VRGSRGVAPAPPPHRRLEHGREKPMFDIAATAIAVACFAFLFALLYVLERV